MICLTYQRTRIACPMGLLSSRSLESVSLDEDEFLIVVLG
jgi:hypothetical protein